MWTMVLKASSPFSMIWVAIFVLRPPQFSVKLFVCQVFIGQPFQLLKEVVVQVLQCILHVIPPLYALSLQWQKAPRLPVIGMSDSLNCCSV